MYYKYSTNTELLEAPFKINLGALALLTYNHFNQNYIDTTEALPRLFKHTIEIIEKYLKLKSQHIYYDYDFEIKQIDLNKNILVACTGGLDSTYQVINLLENHYQPIMFYVCENKRPEIKAIQEISKTLNIDFIRCNFINTSEYIKNNFRNIVLYSLMLDCCQANDIYNLSSGDDLSLDINTAINGVNLAKAKQITETFFNDLYLSYTFNFVPASKVSKLEKLQKLKEYNLLDAFYSCINSEKINIINRNFVQTKYGIKLHINNCGKCYKCCLYNLIRHYYMNEILPDKYLDFCWKQVIDNPYFCNRSLKEKIYNLSIC